MSPARKTINQGATSQRRACIWVDAQVFKPPCISLCLVLSGYRDGWLKVKGVLRRRSHLPPRDAGLGQGERLAFE